MHLPPQHMPAPQDARSAPANLVFDTTSPLPLPSPGDLDFDLSPLSPWMDAYKPDPCQQPRRNKRTASPPDEGQRKIARQRPSPTPRVPPTPNSTKRNSRGTKSASSTPLLRSSRARGRTNSTSCDIPGDTPSPVDLSMPPPGPPISQLASLASAMGPVHNITPVTPSSLMNMGGLDMSSGLSPPTHAVAVKTDGKSKSAGRGKDTPPSATTSKRGNVVSPSLKPILPGNIKT